MVAIIYEFNGKQYVSATTYIKLEQENKKLKEELKKDDREVQVDVDKELLKANDYLIKENKNLKERVEFLEQCLDNKEKVNKSLREELKIYKKQYEHSMGEDRETDIEELIDRNIDVAKRLANK